MTFVLLGGAGFFVLGLGGMAMQHADLDPYLRLAAIVPVAGLVLAVSLMRLLGKEPPE